MALIGFSTGCLYQTKMSISDRVKFYSSIGANAVELSFAYPKDLLDFRVDSSLKRDLGKFDFVSIHSPFFDVSYGRDGYSQILEKLRELSPVARNGFVFHPNDIFDPSALSSSGIEVLVENMDKNKKFGNVPIDLKKFSGVYSGFVLDLFHVYEMDSSMGLTNGFLDVMGEELKHLHVSGSTDSNRHYPLHLSDNCLLISQTLRDVFQRGRYPIIFEGNLGENFEKSGLDELSYVRSIVN